MGVWAGDSRPPPFFKACMNLDEIITVLENKVRVLENAKSASIANGDMSILGDIEIEILSTQASLDKIKTLCP